MITSFTIAPTPQLHFGAGQISVLPSAIKTFGSKLLLITGQRSFTSSLHYSKLLEQLATQHISVEHYCIDKEPTPQLIDTAVQMFFTHKPDVIVAIGGGSVLDAGKAIAAMLPLNEAVKDYLEGVGKHAAHPGVKIPFIAVPTTSGTGSEATKNAVVTEVGEKGYKKSLRHNNFVPDVAIIDPALTISCSPQTTAASGMDAFTQLLESYLSTTANPFTDALAYEGLNRISTALLNAYHDGTNVEARTEMTLAAYLSGITLANAGLGIVHGFASSIGGYFEIQHGILCSTLMYAANKITIEKLRVKKSNEQALHKYATVGKLFAKVENKSNDYYIDSFIATLQAWTTEMNIPSLSQKGIVSADFDRIVKITDNKNNPVPLTPDEMIEVLVLANERYLYD